MENQSSLANPKKLSLADFPPEQKPRKESRWEKFRKRQKYEAKFKREERKRKRIESKKRKNRYPGFFERLVLDFKQYREDRKWKNKHSSKPKLSWNFLLSFFLFFLGPLLDLRDEIKAERLEKKLRKESFPQPNIFQRLWMEYLETRDTARQRKRLDKVLRRSLSVVLEEDKRVFSMREELAHMRDTWKSLPWNWNREIQNMIVMTLVFVLTFSIVFGAFQLVKFGVAAAFGIPGVWRNGMIVFTIPDPSLLWTYSSVISVYGIGPLFLLIVGLVFQRLQRKVTDQGSLKSLVFMWIFIHAYILVFGTFLAGVFTDRGFGYVMGWLYIPRMVEAPLALFSVLMLWIIGYRAGRKFLIFRHSDRFIDTVLPQLYFKLMYFYVPILVGIGILYLFGFNANDFTQNIVYLSIIVMLTPTLRFIPEKL